MVDLRSDDKMNEKVREKLDKHDLFSRRKYDKVKQENMKLRQEKMKLQRERAAKDQNHEQEMTPADKRHVDELRTEDDELETLHLVTDSQRMVEDLGTATAHASVRIPSKSAEVERGGQEDRAVMEADLNDSVK